MGTDAMAVTTPDLRVHGVPGLRVHGVPGLRVARGHLGQRERRHDHDRRTLRELPSDGITTGVPLAAG